MMFQVHENTTVKYLNRVYAGIIEMNLIRFTTFFSTSTIFFATNTTSSSGAGGMQSTTYYKV